MKLFRRVWVVALLAVCAAMWAGSAWAESYVTVNHNSSAPLVNGKPDYENAAFDNIGFWVGFEPALTNPPAEGTFELVDSADFTTSSGTVNQETPFECQLIIDSYSDSYTEYTTALQGTRISFRGEAQDREKGLPNKGFRWIIGEYDGNGQVMDFLTTEQQITQNAAPSVELSNTAVTYRIAASFPGKARINFYNAAGTRLYRTSWIEPGDGTINFADADVNVNGSDIARVAVQLRPSSDTTQRYVWNFHKTNVTVSYGVEAKPTLDSTGKKLTLEFSFYENGQKVDVFEPLGSEGRTDFTKYLAPGVTIRTSGDSAIGIEELPSKTQTYSIDKVIGEYDLSAPLETGDYLLYYESLEGTSAFDALPSEQQEILEQKYDGFIETLDVYENLPVNGGEPVRITREANGGGGGGSSGSGGGCNAGIGLFGLLLAGLVTFKRRKA
jgi:hypothetical protein